MKTNQINAAIERAHKLISLSADKAEIDPQEPNIIRLPEEWSLAMRVAHDVLTLGESLRIEIKK